MIAVFGAGAIGCFVGGMLVSAGERVLLIGRQSTRDALSGGLTIVPFGRKPRTLDAAVVPVATDPAKLAAAGMVLVCVKSQDTAEAARTIAAHAAPNALVISLQNGLGNVEMLAEALGPGRVVAGMVGFNVVRPEPATFRQTTDGGIIVGVPAQALATGLFRAGVEAETHENMPGIQWSKLILNLSNPLNALAGVPLRQQLLDRDWRRISADCATEAIAVARAQDVRLERLGGVPPAVIPHVLRLPTPIFRVIAGALLHMDPTARTSMAQDLDAGKDSELPWLNGAVAARGRQAGVLTPVNDAIIDLTEAAFARGASPNLTGTQARSLIAIRKG